MLCWCKSNYDSQKKTVDTRGVPTDPDEEQRWIDEDTFSHGTDHKIRTILTEPITRNAVIYVETLAA